MLQGQTFKAQGPEEEEAQEPARNSTASFELRVGAPYSAISGMLYVTCVDK